MGKVADLSDFDRGQIVMARRLGKSISETTRLVGCSRTTVVSTYAKWMNDGETSSRRHGVGRPHAIKKKGRRRQSRMNSIGAHCSADTVGYRARSKRPTRVPLLTKRHRQLRLRWVREHGDWSMDQWERVACSDESLFVIHHADGRVRIRRLPGEQLLPQCTVGHTQAGGGGIMLWGTFSWASLGLVVVVEQTMNATGYLNIIADQLHPYMTSVFPAGNGMFEQENAPCYKAKIVLEWFQEHAELQLMSLPPNSPDLNPIEHIWDVMGRQLRVQRPPIRNISDLRDRCLNIW
ncbi:transposable element Tc1 transposase [Trichonephila clavipes]|nr:transposable element Tc1 transposase [Trichonephila clavipes]